VFFDELGLPLPDVNLGVGSGSHAEQTAAIMIGLERLFEELQADLVIVYGDVNSTLAAAVVASKMGIRLCHVEAGLRSFDRTMPEEINRVITDRLCDLLLVTSPEAIAHLASEGVAADAIHLVGNPMIDTLVANRSAFDAVRARQRHGLADTYLVATLHRPGNVDDPANVAHLVEVLHRVADQAPVVLPLHPRGRERLFEAGLRPSETMVITDPLGYLEFLSLVSGAAAVITDSGGVQEETTFLGVPCLTLRPNTERPVTITDGTNRLVTLSDVESHLAELLAAGRPVSWPVPPLWDGRAGERIARVLSRELGWQPA
jgi:UDP-N-acetylglucosamine 2-epimerase (non-hydrolysing)